ncbi:translation initiation factor IF-2 [Hyphomicrobium denitrificans 1NES1]|uniref:Translation initiation factor IF-2 n=1 Tax=Hyphomicrobium denitrificans 1NES1 TaxID=670307 RepID=N0B8Q3_9HYPH|nr:translation initiation factor IF-2 [Hyphomicrobium denitrificans]AGK59984.1 translation initiation factor IF-2 [Hyphomicrobium denitrificans 1NES1]
MTDSNDQTDKTIRVGARKPLSLQRTVESGHVRQNFSHGRSKSVVVEKKKTRRLSGSGPEGGEVAPAAPTTSEAPPLPVKAPPAPAARPASSSSSQARTLSNEERAARERALAAARAEGASRAVEAEPVRFEPVRPPEPEPRVEEAPAQNAPPAATATPPAAPKPAEAPPAPVARETAAPRERRDNNAPQSREGGRPPFQRTGGRPTGNTAYMPREAGRPREIELPVPPRRGAAPADATTIEKPVRPQRPVVAREQVEDDDSRKRGPGGAKVPRPAVKTNDDGRQRQKLTITNFDREAQVRSLASLKRKREKEKLKAMGIQQPREKIAREVVIPEAITIQELSNRMAERAVDLIKYLMQQGAMHKITDVLDADTAELIVQEFGHTPKRVSEADVEIGFVGEEDADSAALEPRAPVVTIMGHVDHGKTSLLDAIRSANVVAGEAGGITQHIGAYQVKAANGDKITFIDTPGHEAFTAMRARGAKVTDIVVLVVAADDGVMPQTVEAINHAKAAKVPIIVAINKIDKPQADPNRVRTDLLSQEIVVESMGGETLEVPVSALKRTNLDKLLEAIHLQAEILDLKANPTRTAEGIVIEAKLERGRGPVGTVLVQRGTLHVGDIIVAGTAWGRVRALLDDHGANIDSAGPSVPAEVLGFDSAPEAGDQFAVVENEARARELTDYRVRKRRETLGSAGSKSTLEQMMQQLKDAERKEFPLVVKGDVQGSVEAIAGALRKVGNDEVEARLVHSGVGGITESDIALAAASKAVVIGFNVRANAQAKQAADSQGIEIRYYNIIYDLVDEVKAAMSGLLAPTKREVFLGYATIKQVFNISKVGKVAGCQVTEGKVERGAKVRLLRDNVVIHEGTLAILKRFKDDVKEVVAGQECGMSFANYQDIREGDQIECFQVETIARSL